MHTWRLQAREISTSRQFSNNEFPCSVQGLVTFRQTLQCEVSMETWKAFGVASGNGSFDRCKFVTHLQCIFNVSSILIIKTITILIERSAQTSA